MCKQDHHNEGRRRPEQADFRAVVRRELRGLRLGCWRPGASNPARATGTTSARSPTPTSTPAATAPPSNYYSCSMVIVVMHTLLTLLEPLVLIQ